MRKLIINADDCGRTEYVDNRIEHFIQQGKISSTTVMANMYDFDGAVRLYKTYKDTISFGAHLNLTEGAPLLYSQPMLDAGLYKEEDGNVVFDVQWSRGKVQPKIIREAIFNEFDAQLTKIRDAGIDISHIDSHHHIYTTLLCLLVTPKIAAKHNIRRIRRLNNYRKPYLSFLGRQAWALIERMQNTSLRMTDYFADYGAVYADAKAGRCKNGIIEIMCHPGGLYIEEEELMLREDIVGMADAELINYNQL